MICVLFIIYGKSRTRDTMVGCKKIKILGILRNISELINNSICSRYSLSMLTSCDIRAILESTLTRVQFTQYYSFLPNKTATKERTGDYFVPLRGELWRGEREQRHTTSHYVICRTTSREIRYSYANMAQGRVSSTRFMNYFRRSYTSIVRRSDCI